MKKILFSLVASLFLLGGCEKKETVYVCCEHAIIAESGMTYDPSTVGDSIISGCAPLPKTGWNKKKPVIWNDTIASTDWIAGSSSPEDAGPYPKGDLAERQKCWAKYDSVLTLLKEERERNKPMTKAELIEAERERDCLMKDLFSKPSDGVDSYLLYKCDGTNKLVTFVNYNGNPVYNWEIFEDKKLKNEFVKKKFEGFHNNWTEEWRVPSITDSIQKRVEFMADSIYTARKNKSK